MSELEFLCPDLAVVEDGFRPAARSPMHARIRALGARFDLREGWMVVAHVPGEADRALAVRDISHVAKVEVRGTPPDGVAPPETICLGPGRWLVLGKPGDAAALRSALRADGRLVIDQTAALAGLEINGPGALTLMRRLTDLDLDRLPAVGALAHIYAVVVRDGDEAFRIYFSQQHGDYLWAAVVDTALPLGGGPAA